MRLAMVEDNVSLLENLKLLLDGEPDIEVVGAFVSAGDALESLGSISAEVLLVDLGLPDMSGVELIRRAKSLAPELDIMVHTVFDDWNSVFSALKAGAAGYILKGSTPRTLVEAVTDVYRGGAPMSPKIARMVITEFHENEPDSEGLLTPREKEILRDMETGLAYKEIAGKLHISPHTVRTHIKNIYEKLHAKNRSEAILKARKKGNM